MSQSEPSSSSKVVIITGASSGIGWGTATVLAAQGHRLVLCARRAERLEELRSEVEAGGGEAVAVPLDVAKRGEMERAADAAMDRWGRIDVLVNNAGVMMLSPMEALRVDDWIRMLRVNVEGVLHGIAAVLPTMIAQESGHIVNVGSLAGRRPFPGAAVYSATKFAVRSITAGLQLELSASKGIRVTDIQPGVVRTELMDHIPHADTRQMFADRWADKRPLESEDIGEAIRFVIEADPRMNVNEMLIRPTDQAT